MKTMNLILSEVSDFYSVSTRQLKALCRKQQLIWPRHVAMCLGHSFGVPYKSIAKLMNRDYSMVSHANKKVREFCQVNTTAKKELSHLTTKIINKKKSNGF